MLPCFNLCGAQGWVCWEEDNDPISGPWDHDAVEWLVVLHLPLIPRRAWHTFDWSSEAHVTHFGPHLVVDCSFQVYPIRLSGSLIARSFLRRWLYVMAPAGLVAVLQGFLLTDLFGQVALLTLGIGLTGFSLACAIWLKLAEGRTRRIRRLLGRHRRGSSDPATWTDEDCTRIPEAQDVFRFSCYEDAVEALLEKGDHSGAMWAARLSIVKEGRLRGEQLTDRVLRHPEVTRCLAGAEENPKAWLEALRARGVHNEALIS